MDCSSPTNLRTINRRSLVMVEANASANPAADAVIPGVIRQAAPVAPTIPADKRLKRIDNHRFTVTYLWNCCKFNRGTTYHPTSNNKDLNSWTKWDGKLSIKSTHTVSTHLNISLKNFEDAPKARRIATPEMVSPYIEYKGDLVTESVKDKKCNA